MLKFLKRLFLLSIVLLIGAGFWGYYNGMAAQDVKAFISGLLPENQAEAPSPKIEEEPKPKAVTPKAKAISPKKKVEKYELQPLPVNPYSAIDRHARKAPSTASTDVPSLALYLQEKARTDLEKARAIYVWMTDNISYDDDAYNSGLYPRYTAEYVLKNRKAVCEGFSNLFLALGNEMGIEVKKVTGYAKGYGYTVGEKFKKSDHAWNIVRIDGRWRIFDATWGEGNGKNVNGKLVSTKEFDDYWFNVDPYEAIFSHLPEDPQAAFVSPKISLPQYELMPKVETGYFKLGIDSKATYYHTINNPHAEFPMVYDFGTHVEIIRAPKFKNLSMDKSYEFELYAPRAYKVVLIDASSDWSHFERESGMFRLRYRPESAGKLKLSIQHEGGGNSYSTIMVYHVRGVEDPI